MCDEFIIADPFLGETVVSGETWHLMEYLLTTEEMMDPTSFLEEESPGVCESLSWGQWEEQVGRKRKQSDGVENHHHLPAGLAKSANITQDKTSQPTKMQRREQGQ